MHLYCLNVKRQMVQMKSFDPGGWTYCACTALYLTLLRASLHESDKADVADESFLLVLPMQVELIFCGGTKLSK